jgi:hypothetical protein
MREKRSRENAVWRPVRADGGKSPLATISEGLLSTDESIAMPCPVNA